MNYVQLCQMVHRLIGAGNEAPGSVPADAAALSAAVPGQLVYEIGKFVNDAYEEIVLDQDNWDFLTSELNIAITPKTTSTTASVKNLYSGLSLNLDADVYGGASFNGFMVPYSVLAGGFYASGNPITGIVPDFDSLAPLSETGTFRYLLVNETDGSGNPVDGSSTQCIFTPYKNFRGWSDAMNVTGKPTRFTIAKDGGLWLNTYPDKAYQIRCDYERKFVPLTTAGTAITIQAAKTVGYTFALGDAGQCVPYSSASAGVFLVPQNATVPFPIGTVLYVKQSGSAAVTVQAAAGAALNPGYQPTTGIGSWLELVKTATDVWDVRAYAGAPSMTYPYTSFDTPIFPVKYHSGIAYRAAAMYCEQRPDAERFAQFQKRYLDILDAMRGDLLPEWELYTGAFYE